MKGRSSKERVTEGGLQDERELIRRCREGDHAAYRVLVERYQQKAFRVAYRIVGNEEDALDLVQDAFVKIYGSIHKFKSQSSFYTWFYRIVVNVALDFRRRKKHLATVEYNEQLPSMPAIQDEITIGLDENPQEALYRKQREQAIQEAIDKLPDEQKSAIILREVEGLSYKEIARATEVSIGTVMSRLHYARKKLQEELQEYLEPL